MIDTSCQDNRGDDRGDEAGELSDADLEQVVGGLSRAWYGDGPAMLEPVRASFSVTTLPIDLVRRVSA